jgi:hypothetical protein
MPDRVPSFNERYVLWIRASTVMWVGIMILCMFHRAWFYTSASFAILFFLSVIGQGVVRPSERALQKSRNHKNYFAHNATAQAVYLYWAVIFIVLVVRGNHWYFAFPLAFIVSFIGNMIPMAVIGWLAGGIAEGKSSVADKK